MKTKQLMHLQQWSVQEPKQTNDLTTEQSVEGEKEPKIYGNKFRYRRLKYNDDNKAEFRNRNQALKGTQWMPWCQKAMKDVISCDKHR